MGYAMIEFEKIKAFLFDLDGCIYYGDAPAPGARELLAALEQDGIRTFFLSNNSTHTASDICGKLRAMGLPAAPEQVVSVTDLAGHYIRRYYGNPLVKVIGSPHLQAAVAKSELACLPYDADTRADLILIGRDIHFSYEKLRHIAEDAMNGAAVVAANPDPYHLGTGGRIVPETGAIAASLEAILRVKVPYIGKPAPFLFQYVTEKYGLSGNECVMVGDNPATDIAGGAGAGLHTVWIRDANNRFSLDDVAADLAPDCIVSSLHQLLELYRRHTNP